MRLPPHCDQRVDPGRGTGGHIRRTEIAVVRQQSFNIAQWRETDFVRQRQLMRQFEKLVLDTEAHEIFLLWRYRIVPYRSYVKGWKVSPSHYVNQDLATIWLDK